MIFQQFNLFASRTIYQNVAYPLKHSGLSKAEKKKKVEELLKLVGIEDKADSYPSQLSGGQKQRVAIARALANDPKLLLCDEATSALDPQTTHAILKLLKELNKKLGITVVLITHEMDVIKEICDRVAVMEDGKVVEEGDVFTVFASSQQKIKRKFVDTTSNLSKINQLLEENAEITKIKPGECIVKFKYLVRSVSEPLVSTISRQFHINVNIIFGNVELIGTESIGGLVSILNGKPEDIENALNYLRDALDFGLKTEEAIFQDTSVDEQEYWNIIVARSADLEDTAKVETYRKVVETFQSEATQTVFDDTFGGYFISVGWDEDLFK